MAEESYIQKYLRYTAHQESPDIFHIWGAVSTIAFAIGRSAWVDQSYFNIYPNHYIILVAASGACRKGGAVGVARKLIRDALHSREDRLFIPGKIYPEALIRALNRRVASPFSPEAASAQLVHRPVMLFSPELGSFMSRGMQQLGMPDLLTEIYDCPDEHEHITKNSGVDVLKDVCINLLAATTPTWLQNNMTPAIFGEGFMARTILVYAERPKLKSPRPQISETERTIRGELVERLEQISRVTGPFTWAQGAGEYFDAWYTTREPDDEISRTSGFWERVPDHVIKLSMCFSLSAGAEPIIHLPHVTAAVRMVEDVRRSMASVLVGAGADPTQQNTYRVLNAIERGGTISLLDLGRQLIRWMDPDTIQRCITALRQNGMVESYQQKTHDGVKVFYRFARYAGGVADDPGGNVDEDAGSHDGQSPST